MLLVGKILDVHLCDTECQITIRPLPKVTHRWDIKVCGTTPVQDGFTKFLTSDLRLFFVQGKYRGIYLIYEAGKKEFGNYPESRKIIEHLFYQTLMSTIGLMQE